jgi:HKD family nuclease
MSIRLLEDLQTGEYDTAVFLTYTINLRFFELMILPRLRRMGVSRIGILIDQRGYQNSLADPLSQELCGREYILSPVRLPRGGIQHSKLLWFQKNGKITAYLGSHNLTMASYNDQVEVTAKLTTTNSGHMKALRDLHEIVTSIMPPALHYVWDHTMPPPVINEPPTAIALTNYRRPLIGQIIDHVQTADELRIVTPFLDAFALKALVTAVHAQTVVLDLPKEGADIPLVEAIKVVPGLRARYLENKNRRLHAKSYQFTTSSTSWLAIGSANCTQAALIKSVAEGGNLEFLLLLKDVILTDEDLIFTSIDDSATFPHTGRNWDTSPLPSTPIIIEKASYKKKQFSVEWRLPENKIVSDITLFADGHSIPCNTFSASSDSLDIPPRLITLKATIDGNSVETSAWVTNYDALDQRVSQTKHHQWVERIASDDPQQQANSIADWLEQEFQELIQALRDSENTDFHQSVELALKRGKIQASHQFYEVFAYSPDSKQVRASASALMETYSNVDPLVLLRVLLMRFTAVSPFDLSLNINGNDDFQPPDTQQYFSKRKAAAQNIVKNLNRQLDRFMKAEISWSDMPEKLLIEWLRTLFGTVAYISLRESKRIRYPLKQT